METSRSSRRATVASLGLARDNVSHRNPPLAEGFFWRFIVTNSFFYSYIPTVVCVLPRQWNNCRWFKSVFVVDIDMNWSMEFHEDISLGVIRLSGCIRTRAAGALLDFISLHHDQTTQMHGSRLAKIDHVCTISWRPSSLNHIHSVTVL